MELQNCRSCKQITNKMPIHQVIMRYDSSLVRTRSRVRIALAAPLKIPAKPKKLRFGGLFLAFSRFFRVYTNIS